MKIVSPGIVGGLLLAAATALAAEGAEDRVDALLAKMTLAEKIGQMVQVDTAALPDKSHIQKYCLGSVLSGAESDPPDNSPQGWLKLADECQAWARQTRLAIPLLFGVDAVHGHNNVDGAVIFPHNIALGATRNPALVEEAARITAQEVAGTGINWSFAPCIAVAQDARWGRTYESFSDAPELVGELGAAAIRGLQGGRFAAAPSVLACAKHFVADGGTRGGVDQGDAVMDEATLRKIHLSPYRPAIRGGVGSIMISFSSWNSQKLHGHKYLITDVLKGELGFPGLVISDYAAIERLPHDFKGNVEAAINAGLDMAMIPYGPGRPNNYLDFIARLTELAGEGRVPRARIDDAARRILRAKFEIGAFEPKPVDPAWTAGIGSAAHRQVARECVRQSLVLLKNSPAVLPLAKNLKRVQVVGTAANDLGIQCGGWTLSWQGETGHLMRGGTTLLAAIRQTVGSNTVVSFSPDAAGLVRADVTIVVVGETPYAETKGDRGDLRLPAGDVALIQRARATGSPVVTVLLSGRPLILGEALEASDAFVAAWLPGTEGSGVTDVLFGNCKPAGKLPRPWPRIDVSAPAQAGAGNQPFPFGYGLTYGEARLTAER